jgi:Flp pilus assembly protein TadD
MPLFRGCQSGIGLKRAALAAAALVVPLLSACASDRPLFAALSTTASVPTDSLNPADLDKQVQYWGDRYQRNEKNRDVALNYAAVLRQTGSADQALAVLQKAVINFPEDRTVLAAYGKTLAAAGQLPQALDAVQRAQTPDKPDWRLLSTEASIRDQMGDTATARRLHAQAATAVPDDPTVLSNYGMSYVLTGELRQAEALLTKAAALPGADSRVRQNLALVIGLQGRFDEAQKIASADLPPEQAAENVAYLKKMLAQQNTWQALQGSGKSTAKPAAGAAAKPPATTPRPG